MKNVTERQMDILRHSLGLKQSKRQYRNHFVTDEGSRDYEDCEQLVRMGLMLRESVEWGPDNIYIVTEEGIALICENPR